MYIIFKDKKSKRSHKAVGIKVFLTFFAWLRKDPDPDPDPYLWLMDPDPQHCWKGTLLLSKPEVPVPWYSKRFLFRNNHFWVNLFEKTGV